MHRANPEGLGTASAGNRLWSELHWFSDHSKNGFLDRIFQSLVSPDPEEREDAAVLAANLDPWEEDRAVEDRSIPLLPASTESIPGGIRFGIPGALKRNADVLRHMAADERRLVRACFLELIRDHRGHFKEQIDAIALDDPDTDLRLKAVPMLWYGTLLQDLEILRRLAQDANPQVRLLALCLLALEGRSPEALQECILLLSDPDAALPATERITAIESVPDVYGSLSGRCEKTKEAIRTSPGALRTVADEWKSWFRSKEFVEFAAEVSKGR